MIQKFKPFFDFRVKNLEDAIALLSGMVVFSIIVFNAYFNSITYDEAYSYLNTGRIQDVWKVYQFRIANTHFLNSILMTVSTLFFPYYDFALRFPSVIIGLFYVSLSISFSKKYKNGLFLLGLLLLFYYIIGYMSLARGYGMSATFILAALFVFKQKDDFKNYHLWVVYLFLLAVYASYVALVPFAVMMTYLYVVEFNFKVPRVSKKHKWWIFGLTGLSVYGFYSVTKAGKPLPYDGDTSLTLFEAVPLDIVTRFFDISSVSVSSVLLGTSILAAAILLIFFFGNQKTPNGLIAIGTFFAVFLASWAGGKPLPTGRVLVPYWPLVAFAVFEVFEFLVIKLKVPLQGYRILNIFLLAGLWYNFIPQFEFSASLENKRNQWKTPINIMSGYGKSIFPHDTYYLEKDWEHNILQKRLEAYTPDEVKAQNGVTTKTYVELGLVTVHFSESSQEKRLYREVMEENSITYQDTLNLNSEIFNFEDARPLILAFPRFGGEVLKIGFVDSSWSTTLNIPKGMEDFFPPEIRHSI